MKKALSLTTRQKHQNILIAALNDANVSRKDFAVASSIPYMTLSRWLVSKNINVFLPKRINEVTDGFIKIGRGDIADRLKEEYDASIQHEEKIQAIRKPITPIQKVELANNDQTLFDLDDFRQKQKKMLDQLLKSANISKRLFSELIGVKYQDFTNWFRKTSTKSIINRYFTESYQTFMTIGQMKIAAKFKEQMYGLAVETIRASDILLRGDLLKVIRIIGLEMSSDEMGNTFLLSGASILRQEADKQTITQQDLDLLHAALLDPDKLNRPDLAAIFVQKREQLEALEQQCARIHRSPKQTCPQVRDALIQTRAGASA